jgi:hypothetical protein
MALIWRKELAFLPCTIGMAAEAGNGWWRGTGANIQALVEYGASASPIGWMPRQGSRPRGRERGFSDLLVSQT